MPSIMSLYFWKQANPIPSFALHQRQRFLGWLQGSSWHYHKPVYLPSSPYRKRPQRPSQSLFLKNLYHTLCPFDIFRGWRIDFMRGLDLAWVNKHSSFITQLTPKARVLLKGFCILKGHKGQSMAMQPAALAATALCARAYNCSSPSVVSFTLMSFV